MIKTLYFVLIIGVTFLSPVSAKNTSLEHAIESIDFEKICEKTGGDKAAGDAIHDELDIAISVLNNTLLQLMKSTRNSANPEAHNLAQQLAQVRVNLSRIQGDMISNWSKYCFSENPSSSKQEVKK
jgi:hypothetical protein